MLNPPIPQFQDELLIFLIMAGNDHDMIAANNGYNQLALYCHISTYIDETEKDVL